MSNTFTLKKALFAIRKLKQQLQEKNNAFQPIAITGLSCRFPEAANKTEFWQLLCNGKNGISTFPEERWQLLNGTNEAAQRQKNHTYHGGFLKNISAFDPYFFGITPREATRMDPQQRLLLEVAYEALEDAGLRVENLAGSLTGVFTSLYASQFAQLQSLENNIDALYIPTGNAISMASNRLSYLYDLRGPSIVFDTSCSSSLVALHIACLNLQANLCSIALVCAANINLLPSLNLLLSKAKMLSPTGQCKTFDANADGYVQGEGIGAIVLKPLTHAILNNDRIYAVIAGSAINQDGKTNGLTAPNGLQQEALLQAAYQTANINFSDVGYIECHGTGTFLGDPIETQALGETLGKSHNAEKPCWIGSVKTNIGHLEPASGIASIIKMALALHHGIIPPHLNCKEPNPHIAFDKYHLKIPQKIEAWPIYHQYRVGGVSGFGFGGTNAHIVMRELSQEEKKSFIVSPITPSVEEIFTLSAKSATALQLLVKRWCDFLEKNPNLDLAQLCYNLHLKRSHYPVRLAITAHSIQELSEKLKQFPNQPQVTDNKLAQQYLNHEKINWQHIENYRSYPYLDMPMYVWQHEQYWPQLSKENLANKPAHYPFAKKAIPSPLSSKQFEFTFNTKIMPEIADTYHFLHAGFYFEMLSFAGKQLCNNTLFHVTDISFTAPIFVPEDTNVTVQLILEPDDHLFKFIFYSSTDKAQWTTHANGYIHFDVLKTKKLELSQNITQQGTTGTAEQFFSHIDAMNMPTGNSIRWTEQYWHTKDEILCQLTAPASAQRSDDFHLNFHVGVIDACIQSLFLLLPQHLLQAYVASHMKQFIYAATQEAPRYIYSKLNHIDLDGKTFQGDFYLLDSEYNIIAESHNLTMSQLGSTIKTDTIGKQPASTLSPIDYLIEQTAILFSMPKEKVDPQKALQSMGLDSLMAITLNTAIKTGLGINYPMQSLLNNASLQDIVNTIDKKSPELAKAWIIGKKTKKTAKMRLFCFPYGGSGASIYRDWQENFPDTIEICPIQLPGRENRMDEKPLQDMNTLIDLLIANLQNEFDIPFSLFGHSFGALIAFELAHALTQRGLPQPTHLFASAFPDPRTATKGLNSIIAQLEKANINLFELTTETLTTEHITFLTTIFINHGLTEFKHHAFSHEIAKLLLPIFIGDMKLVKNYHFQQETPLNLPITIFSGKQDQWITREDQLGWMQHTQKISILHEIEGDHLFIKNHWGKSQVLDKIIGTLEIC